MFVPTIQIKAQDDNALKLKQSLDRFDDTYDVRIVTGGWRGADKNSLIAKVQAKLGRDPFYLSDELKEAMRFVVGVAFKDEEKRQAQLKKLGQLILDDVLEHIEKGINKGGKAFKDLTDKYAAYKQRKFGFKHPILKATGDLMFGLRAEVKQR